MRAESVPSPVRVSPAAPAGQRHVYLEPHHRWIHGVAVRKSCPNSKLPSVLEVSRLPSPGPKAKKPTRKPAHCYRNE